MLMDNFRLIETITNKKLGVQKVIPQKWFRTGCADQAKTLSNIVYIEYSVLWINCLTDTSENLAELCRQKISMETVPLQICHGSEYMEIMFCL